MGGVEFSGVSGAILSGIIYKINRIIYKISNKAEK